MTEVLDPPTTRSNGNGNGNGELATLQWRGAQLVVNHDASPFANLLDTGKFTQMYRLAEIFSQSAMVPTHFQGKANDCFIAMQMAMRLGVDPFMMLQNTYIVHGRPGMEAKLAIALINSSGTFADPLDYEIEGDAPNDKDYRVRAFAVRKGTGKKVVGPWIDWGIVQAEGWDSKGGSKWKSIPQLMFQYRAATWFGRLHCPERLMGMQTVDELQDVDAKSVQSVVVNHGARGAIAEMDAAPAAPSSSAPGGVRDPFGHRVDRPNLVTDPDEQERILREAAEKARSAHSPQPLAAAPAQDAGSPTQQQAPTAGGGAEWPIELPENARTSTTFIEDAILHFKPKDMARKSASNAFHQIHAPNSWEKAPREMQDQLYAALLDGSVVWKK